MIYTKISDLKKYAFYSDNMRKAIEYLETHDLKQLQMGKTVVDGDSVFINKSNPETKHGETQQYEVHHKYIDIQIDLEGDEKLFITNSTENCTHEYDDAGDYALYKYSKPNASFDMNKDYCVICFPNEIHMPCIKNTTDNVLKCVVKVLDV